MLNPLTHLKLIRDKIASAPRLATGDYAQTADGEHVPVKSSRAVCWCFYGAAAATDPDVPTYENPGEAPQFDSVLGKTWGFMEYYKRSLEPLMQPCLPEPARYVEADAMIAPTAWANDQYADRDLMLQWIDCAIAKAESGA